MQTLTRSRFVIGALAIAVLTLVSMNARPAHAFVYMVNTTVYSPSADHCSAADGPCNLWDAIDSANINPGDDTIVFDQSVFTPGNNTINVVSPLPYPDASEGITIDGGANGVRLEDVPANSSNFGLAFVSDGNVQNVTVNNIAIQDFNYDGIQVCPTPNVSTCDGDVDGVTLNNVTSFINHNDGINILGANISNIELDNVKANINNVDGIDIVAHDTVTNVSMTGGQADENVGEGVNIRSRFGLQSNVTITGTHADSNGGRGFDLLPYSFSGVRIQSVSATDNKYEGISVRSFSTISGATISGSTVAGNQWGIVLNGGALTGDTIKDNTVDGGGGGEKDGISVGASSLNNLLVQGNTVTNQSDQGIYLEARGGGTGNTVRGNTITGTGGTGDGILVCCDQGDGNVHVTVSRNATSSNGGLGIDLAASLNTLGVTPNDPGDGDTGPNNFLNYPEYGAFSDGGKTLNGTACASCLVELFLSDNDSSGFGEGKTFLTDTHADPTGAFSINLCGIGLSDNDIITATATDLPGNTSEFSQNVLINGPLGDCSTATPTPSPTPTPTATPVGQTPTPTPTPGGPTATPIHGSHKQGDLNCDGSVKADDALRPIRFSAGIPMSQPGGCPALDDGDPDFADVNCDGAIGPGDTVAILEHVAGVPIEPPALGGCTPLGQLLPS